LKKTVPEFDAEWFDVSFFQDRPSMEEMLKFARRCRELERRKKDLSDRERAELIETLYHLGSGLIRNEIFGEGVKCFESVLTAATAYGPSNHAAVENAILPAHHFSLYSTLHTLSVLYYRAEQRKRFQGLVERHPIVKGNYTVRSWLFEVLKREVVRKACLRLRKSDSFSKLVGVSEVWLDLLHQIQRVAKSDRPVLIYGPSGSGKQLVAEAIHKESGRTNFVVFDCAAADDNLSANELFGHVKGGYTSAGTEAKGLCDEAANGTLFIDEISKSSRTLQGKLLRLVQERTFRRVGGTASIPFTGRIVAAANQLLEQLVKRGDFLPDLLFRLDLHRIHVPSLYQRNDDIEALVHHFVKTTGNGKKISYEAVERIWTYWEQRSTEHQYIRNYLPPGYPDPSPSYALENHVRELRNLVEKLCLEVQGNLIGREDLPLDVAAAGDPLCYAQCYDIPVSVFDKRATEKHDLQIAMKLAASNISKVARLYRVQPQTMHDKIKARGISKKEGTPGTST
jgi:DNA-binding NtrC family response regulator